MGILHWNEKITEMLKGRFFSISVIFEIDLR